MYACVCAHRFAQRLAHTCFLSLCMCACARLPLPPSPSLPISPSTPLPVPVSRAASKRGHSTKCSCAPPDDGSMQGIDCKHPPPFPPPQLLTPYMLACSYLLVCCVMSPYLSSPSPSPILPPNHPKHANNRADNGPKQRRSSSAAAAHSHLNSAAVAAAVVWQRQL